MRKSLPQLFDSISHIRHDAVHRTVLTTSEIEMYLLDAEDLAKLLRDTENTKRIAELRQKVLSTMYELKRNKQNLRSGYEAIQILNNELVRRQSLETSEKKSKSKEYDMLARKGVEEAIALATAPISTTVDNIERGGRGS
jgi:hypothetical protein